MWEDPWLTEEERAALQELLGPEARTHRVLFVHDDALVRRMAARALGERCECEGAASAEEALKALARAHYDVVVADDGSQGIDCRALMREIGQHCPGIRRILLMRDDETESEAEALPCESILRSAGTTGIFERISSED